MSVFTKSLTNKGAALQAKAQAGKELRYTRFVIGDGRLSGQLLPTMTNVISSKKTIPVTNLGMRPPNEAIVGFTLSNQDVTSGFYFRELGLYAMDPDEGEILYLYANAGETADYIPPAGSDDVIQKSFDTLAFVGQAQNVTANIDHSLVYVTHPELNEAIAGLSIADASLIKKGITLLSNATNGTRENVAATEKAVKTAYDKGAKAEEDAATAQARAVTAESSAKSHTDAKPWQKSQMTADNGIAITLPAGTNLHTFAFKTGHYMGTGITNAPDSDWWYYDVRMHNASYILINAYRVNNPTPTFRQKTLLNGVWGAWSEDLFTSVSDGKALLKGTIVTGKGGTVSQAGSTPTFAELDAGVKSIQQGRYLRQEISLNSGNTLTVPIPTNHLGQIGPYIASFPAGTKVISVMGQSYSSHSGQIRFNAWRQDDDSLWIQPCLFDDAGRQWILTTENYGHGVVTYLTMHIINIQIDLVTGTAFTIAANGTSGNPSGLTRFNSSMPSGFNLNGVLRIGYAVTSRLNVTNRSFNMQNVGTSFISM